MLVLSFFTWWYARGWADFIHRSFEKLRSTYDFFSIGQLLKTLFLPYRQVSTITRKSTIFEKITDKFISCVVGFFIRFFIILFGIISLAVQSVIFVIFAILWPLFPALPFICVVMFLKGGF
jgi:hypothetical protein